MKIHFKHTFQAALKTFVLMLLCLLLVDLLFSSFEYLNIVNICIGIFFAFILDPIRYLGDPRKGNIFTTKDSL